MENALQNIKVLDLSRVLAGPLGTMLLADMGADVLRIEQPGGSDDIRHWYPFVEGESTYYMAANRNKRSMTLNLKTDKGRALFEELVKKADIVVENFKTGTLDRLGLGYHRMKSIKPDIILCSITGYGQTGPMNQHPGYDPVIQAVGGLMDVTGEEDGEATRVGTPVVDIMTSHYVAISILGALRVRDQEKKPQHIDLSLLDVQVSSLANIASSYLLKNHISKRSGNAHGNITPYETFQCADDPIMIAAGNDRMFAQVTEVLGHPEWAKEARFTTNHDRIRHREELRGLLQSVFIQKPATEWEKQLSNHGVPCGAVNNIQQVFEHPQVQHRQMVKTSEHETLGEVPSVRNPITSNDKTLPVDSAPPLLGANTKEILEGTFGFNDESIRVLKEEGVV
ncbi:crotonobetainyl-CoA:carnitine CoA-transferase CaiB-like acyl-CoA transferase [Geomicrobium halophilum]|uniref:Crotonobetainyl-CoA:carnitine CoA-transferase CaiB-like acyl-CoA transferase n=1 Tax=Geomicrobium halophilum TaxID=549000 RepID=A0A841PZL7_9BACL|nr:CoA transferase [Geomicrobium halophilum]MBB6450192.1 crotonobetainyl-CoA:carnitine CoA-transferase CaiB-like acyl-CoA transferase [Geomicrobium halophilum]